jgi:hypothetical protein
MGVAFKWVGRHAVALLLCVLVVLQFLTWRAIISASEEVDLTRSPIYGAKCGGSGRYEDPCRVSIVNH